MMNDQRRHWDSIRRKGLNRTYSQKPSSFARESVSLLPDGSRVLELGCGWGDDAAFFARQGHKVVATDFSAVAVDEARARYGDMPGLRLLAMDTAQGFSFADGSFDVVYAHLSLHYFTDEVTRRVFREIYRVLMRGGLLMFLCKSVCDPLYGQGRLIEPDMFEREGHVRHFFSEAYARACLGADFDVLDIESDGERFDDRLSSYVKVRAKSR